MVVPFEMDYAYPEANIRTRGVKCNAMHLFSGLLLLIRNVTLLHQFLVCIHRMEAHL